MRYLLILMLLSLGQTFGQISFEARPLSFANPNFDYSQVPLITKDAIDVDALLLEDDMSVRPGLRSGITKELNVSLTNSGVWRNLDDGSRVWLLKLKAPNSKATSVYLENISIPEGGFLSIYAPDKSIVKGAFDARSFNESGYFNHDDIPGDEIIIELFEPANAIGQSYFDLASLCYMYVLPEHYLKAAGACNVDVNCSEGSAWADVIRSVVRIKIKKGTWVGWCSGVLVNNTNNDCRPLVLTAWHCGLGNTSANPTVADLNGYLFYFNYERLVCGTGTGADNSVLGCGMLGNSQDGGGDTGSDFMLVEMNASIPWSYDVYFAGWDATGNGSPSGVSIHHPSGDVKKISTYTAALTSSAYGTATGSHWRNVWVATANGHGITEGGSSGGPIFNSAGRVLGQLTGGAASCSNLSGPDLYGKMSYNWNSNVGVGGDQLQPLLDPNGTGLMDISGTYQPCTNTISEEVKEFNVIIYPNPAKSFITIQSENYGSYSLTLLSLDGKILKSSSVVKATIFDLNLDGISSGLYLLKLRFQNASVTKKIIIE